MGLFHSNSVRAEVHALKETGKAFTRDRLGRGDRETGAGYVYDAGPDWGSPAARENVSTWIGLLFRDAQRQQDGQ